MDTTPAIKEDTNKKLENILKNKLDELLSNETKRSIKDAPQCTYINLKGIRCHTKCVNSPCDENPRCALHINRKEVKECSFIVKDENNNDVPCCKLTRSATGLCYYHSVSTYNRKKGKEYYHSHKEKILEVKKLTTLINKLDKLSTQIDDIICA